jgi:hypothetical protein
VIHDGDGDGYDSYADSGDCCAICGDSGDGGTMRIGDGSVKQYSKIHTAIIIAVC